MIDFDPYDCLVPIFIETEIPQRTEQFATAVFVQNDMGYFLYTAAHVTDDIENGTFLVPTGGHLQELDGYFAYIDLLPENERKDDHIDIAYFKLSNAMASKLFHNYKPAKAGQHTKLIKSAFELTVCSVAGYPASKGKKRGDVFSSEVYSFTGIRAGQDVYDAYELDPVLNIIMHFNQENVVNLKNGDKFTPPSMNGVSGGGIFAWPVPVSEIPDWSERKLVGIFHTYKKREKLIIGTTLLPLLSLLSLGRMKGFGDVN